MVIEMTLRMMSEVLYSLLQHDYVDPTTTLPKRVHHKVRLELPAIVDGAASDIKSHCVRPPYDVLSLMEIVRTSQPLHREFPRAQSWALYFFPSLSMISLIV
jgi:hypothetical protein